MDRIPKSFSGSTQLVAMALEGLWAESALFALPPEPGLPLLFKNVLPRPRFLYHDYSVYLRDRESIAPLDPDCADLVFSSRCEGKGAEHDLGVIFLPKSTELIEFVFSSAGMALKPGARVMVVGPKKSAIRSSKPLMEKCFGEILSSRSARHCVLIESKKTKTPSLIEGERSCSIEFAGKSLEIVTLPGVFSHGKLDEGTDFLLAQLRALPFEKALDWGCGAGVIGAALKLAHPEKHVDFVDSNVMALEATRRTLASNGFATDSVWPSDIFSDVHGRYDVIVSNPPFHKKLETDFSITERFLREAGEHLTGSGRLIIVANAFINYFPPLRESFGKVEVVAENTKFRVIEAKAPRIDTD